MPLQHIAIVVGRKLQKENQKWKDFLPFINSFKPLLHIGHGSGEPFYPKSADILNNTLQG